MNRHMIKYLRWVKDIASRKIDPTQDAFLIRCEPGFDIRNRRIEGYFIFDYFVEGYFNQLSFEKIFQKYAEQIADAFEAHWNEALGEDANIDLCIQWALNPRTNILEIWQHYYARPVAWTALSDL